MICIWSSWSHCHCHPIISCLIKIHIGLTYLVSAYPGCTGKEAVKRVSVNWLLRYGHQRASKRELLRWPDCMSTPQPLSSSVKHSTTVNLLYYSYEVCTVGLGICLCSACFLYIQSVLRSDRSLCGSLSCSEFGSQYQHNWLERLAYETTGQFGHFTLFTTHSQTIQKRMLHKTPIMPVNHN